MKVSLVPAICAAIIGMAALSTPVFAQKTAKACEEEWRANKAANQDKGITEKAYVEKCRADTKAAEPKAAPTAKEKAAVAKEEKAAAAKAAKAAKEEKAAAAAKEKAAAKDKAPAAAAATSEKTVKACEDEWRKDKAGNQAKGITEKAYVEKCRGGAAAAQPTAAPAAAAPAKVTPTPAKEKTAAPAAAPKAAPAAAAAPAGPNQYAMESLAKVHCPTATVVWANLDSKIYHFSGHEDYGHTKIGAYMCEKDAMGQGMRAAKNEKHP